MKLKCVSLLVFLQVFVSVTPENSTSYSDQTSKLLSRRKRFLLFPEGTSFQLVYCVNTAAVITIGDIFLYGNTASLAWALPTDAKMLLKLTGYGKGEIRRGDVVDNIYYLDENGKVTAKMPYKSKQIIHPVFAKRSIGEDETFKQKLKNRIDREKMHEMQGREYLKKDHMDSATKDFHRSSRVELLEKFEFLFTALGQDGRQCVLYKLCQAAQAAPQQGTFQEEFFRVVFTLPKGSPFEEEDHKAYDQAHNPTEGCNLLYPGCENF